jgi:hypothetical protein
VLQEDMRQVYEQHFGAITHQMVNKSCIILRSKGGAREGCQYFNILSYVVEFQLAYNWTCDQVMDYKNLTIRDLECIPSHGKQVWHAFLKWKNAINRTSSIIGKFSAANSEIISIPERMSNPTSDPKSGLVMSTTTWTETELPAFTIIQSVKEIYDGLKNDREQITVQNESLEVVIPQNLDEYLRNNSYSIPISVTKLSQFFNFKGVTRVDFQPLHYEIDGGWFDPEILNAASQNCDSSFGFKFVLPVTFYESAAHAKSILIARAYNMSSSIYTYYGLYDISALNSSDPDEIKNSIADSYEHITRQFQVSTSVEAKLGGDDFDTYQILIHSIRHLYLE